MHETLETIAFLSNQPEDIGSHHGRSQSDLASSGDMIGPDDLLIAAHARAAGLTVVTGNEREFGRVPGLRVENWLGE